MFAEGMPPDEDLGYIEEEYTLYCHICDQRFSNSHNRKEHLAGRQHLNKLRAEMTKQACPPKPPEPEEPEVEEEEDSSGCCIHCVNRVTDVSLDVSLDINTHIETFIFKHSQRELELQTLRANLKHLKEINSQLSKELISLQVSETDPRLVNNWDFGIHDDLKEECINYHKTIGYEILEHCGYSWVYLVQWFAIL